MPTTTLTRRTLLRATAATLGLTGAALLAACGNATTAPQASAPAAPAAAAPPSTTPAPPVATTLPAFNGIPQGRTPEGFFTLGTPDAPVTLIDYSDFL